MNKRIASIDVLRGVTIFMMVLCSTIGWNSNLPAWMFHCQVPPPSYVFDPLVKGITWVDLVFPFFLFSMGAALPFSLGGKIRRGESTGKIILAIVKRWLVLAAYGLILGNAGQIMAFSDGAKCLVRFGIWCGMFLALWRIPDHGRLKGWMVNLLGALVIVAMLILETRLFDVTLTVKRHDIIIMVLSSVALVGGLIWYFTRDRRILRMGILLAACIFKEIDWQAHCLGFLQVPESLYWLINWRYLQYIVVILIGTLVGDILSKATKDNALLCAEPKTARAVVAAVISALMIPISLWAFFTRHIWILLAVAVLAFAAILILGRGDRTAWKRIARIGYMCLILGIVFDPIDGGITKDHCNLSYMLSTGGLACLATSFLLWCEAHAALRGGVLSRNFSYAGQNPMIGYTVTGFVILPVLYALGFSSVYEWAAGNPLLGVLEGLFVTSLMLAFTCLMTRLKVFWRS